MDLMPTELLREILIFAGLTGIQLCLYAGVCRRWRELILDFAFTPCSNAFERYRYGKQPKMSTFLRTRTFYTEPEKIFPEYSDRLRILYNHWKEAYKLADYCRKDVHVPYCGSRGYCWCEFFDPAWHVGLFFRGMYDCHVKTCWCVDKGAGELLKTKRMEHLELKERKRNAEFSDLNNITIYYIERKRCKP